MEVERPLKLKIGNCHSHTSGFSLSRRRALRLALAAVGGFIVAGPAFSHPRSRKFQHVQITTDGGHRSRAVFSDLDNPPAPAVMLVHDHWGASASVRWVASELGRQGFLAVVPDLFDGRVVENESQGRRWLADLDANRSLDVLTSWTRWLKAHFYSTGRVATLAWGGGCDWSLQASIRENVAAAVVYYPEQKSARDFPADASVPIMGHLDERTDAAIPTTPAPATYAAKGYEHWYQYSAKAGFADFIRPSFDASADALAWKRTLAFLNQRLKR